ncbi:MAG: hypothetical protein ACYTFI_20790 [Planctomycetota bacterium]|jgi:hypothetical protein
MCVTYAYFPSGETHTPFRAVEPFGSWMVAATLFAEVSMTETAAAA